MAIHRGRFGPIRPLVLLLPCSILGLSACESEPEADREGALSSLIAAERDFAAAANELGMNQAFLANLTEDAILFRPRPVTGVAYLRSAPPTPGLLAWDPEFADLSADGLLGYTTGPWVYRSEPGGEPAATGRYLTFWRRGPDGEWKAVIDHGITGPVPDGSLDPDSPVETPPSPAGPRAIDDPGSVRASLLTADSTLSLRFGDSAAESHISADVRILRSGAEPRFGMDALWSGLPGGTISFRALGAGVAPESGDLGYTYGEFTLVPPDTAASPRHGTYMRGWRHDGEGWRLVIDLIVPLPPGA